MSYSNDKNIIYRNYVNEQVSMYSEIERMRKKLIDQLGLVNNCNEINKPMNHKPDNKPPKDYECFDEDYINACSAYYSLDPVKQKMFLRFMLSLD